MSAERQKTILLVEDEVIIAMAEKMTLENFGYKVITANTGEEAVALVEKAPAIDLILMDIDLGSGMDGTEAAAIILQQRDLPVVFLSSHMEPEIVEKTEKITSYGYAVKNSSITVLDASIKMAFKLFEAKTKEQERESQMVAALEALQESEQRLNFHVNNSPLAAIEWTTDFIVTRWSDEAEKIFGWNQSETIGKPMLDLKMIHDEDIPLVQKTMERLCDGSSKRVVSTNRNYTKEGKVIVCEWYNSVFLNTQGEMISIMSQGMDITERSRDESQKESAIAALRVSEARAQALLRTIPDMLFRVNRQGVYLDYQANFSDLYDQSGSSLIGKSCRDILPADFADLLEAKFGVAMESGALQTFEYQLPVPGRGIRDYEARMAASGADEVTVIVRDITESKRAEAALQKSEMQLKAMLENSPVVVLLIQEGKLIYINPAVEKLIGWQEEEFIGKNFANFVHKDDMEIAVRNNRKRMGGNSFLAPYVLRILKKTGGFVYAEINGTVIDVDGKPTMLGFLTDITERKLAEEALRISEAKQANALQMTKAGNWEYDVDSDMFTFNDNFYRIFRTTAAAVGGYQMSSAKYAQRFCHPDDAFQVGEETRAAMASADPDYSRQIEHRILYADGEIGYIAVRFFIIKDTQGRTIKTYGVNQDISKQKQAEEVLRKINSRLELAMNAADMAWWTMDMASGHVLFEKRKAEMLGFPPEQFKHYQDFMALVHPDDRERAMNAMRGHLDGSLPRYEVDYRIAASSGEYIWFHDIGSIGDRDVHGKPLNVTGLVINISGRKKAEAEIQRQLTEKEMLLKEVHHRIKNNFAAISGLLSLHMQAITSPEAVAALQDAIGRIDSMRLLYEKLLLGGDFQDASTKNYIENLATSVVSLFPDLAKVKLNLDVDDFKLDPKRLFPLGIIINELLTNIMKYAFAGKKSGTIKLSLAKDGIRVTLTLQDDGVGLPDDFDSEKSKGFGLMLVKMLSQQLGGSFSIEKHKGTRCVVVFNWHHPRIFE